MYIYIIKVLCQIAEILSESLEIDPLFWNSPSAGSQ